MIEDEKLKGIGMLLGLFVLLMMKLMMILGMTTKIKKLD